MADKPTKVVDDIRCSATIGAPLATVWRVMTSEATTPTWLGCLNYRCEVGHVFHMQPHPTKRDAGDLDGATYCEILEIDPTGRFVFSWFVPGMPSTTVRFQLTALSDAETRLELIHEGWDRFPAELIRAIRDGLAAGWSGHVVPALKRAAETEAA